MKIMPVIYGSLGMVWLPTAPFRASAVILNDVLAGAPPSTEGTRMGGTPP